MSTKKLTDWAFYHRHGVREVIRFEYGFTCIRGNSEPYFSVTGEVWRAAPGPVPKPRGRDCVACGMLHNYLPTPLRWLRKAIPFHLFGVGPGPMHYQANALYWLEQATGVRDGSLRLKSYDPDPITAFKNTIIFCQVEVDSDFMVESLVRMGPESRVMFLADRLPLLHAKFREMVRELDLESELHESLAFFK